MTLPSTLAQAMNTISGRVILKESGAGIPDLLVVVYSAVATAGASPSAATIVAASTLGDRLGSVLTSRERGNEGFFQLSYSNDDLKVSNAQERRPDLHLSVLAPEETGVTPQQLVLFSALMPRQRAAPTEQYIIRLLTAQLQKASIPVPSGISQDLEPAQNVVGRLDALAARQNSIVDGAVAAAQKLVDAHRTRVASFHQNFKPALVNALSKLPAAPLNPNHFVAAGESVFTKTAAVVAEGVQGILNTNDPRGFISLTVDQVNQLQPQVGADGAIPGVAVAAATSASAGSGPTTFVQAIDRLPPCQPATPSLACADSILNPPAPANGNPPPVPGAGVTSITSDDMPRYLARLMEPLTAPEEELVVGLMPVATRDTVQNSVQSFVFEPSPADVPAFHDFNNLQIAFDYVWQEAIDQGVLDLAQNAYQTIVGLGGNPDHPNYQNVHPVRTLTAEGNLVLAANAAPTVIVRDHRGEPPGTRLSAPATPVVGVASGSDCSYASGAVVRDHRAGATDPMTIADPVERLPALLQALNKKLLENYNFTIYAANDKERSVNFGILNTYRQIWTPLSYQAGPLVKTIPLAPKQTQKLVITRKTVKKRSQKEVENNLRVLKEETSQTDRAEQEIVNRAMTKTTFSIDHQDGVNAQVSNDTTTMKFSHDAQKNSDDTKKSFREAVFKASQELKQEKTTEITSEQTQEFESVETTEISNPNDEIAVTYLFYELQRRYRLFERLYRVEPVVLVAQEFPQPGDIDQAWLVRHDWILRRVILDDSYLPVLATLAETAGDEIALEETKANVNQQRCIVDQLRQELAVASQQTTVQRALMDQAVFKKSGASDSGLLGGLESAVGDVVGTAGAVVGDVAGAVGKVGEFLLGGSGQNASNQQAMQDAAAAAADKIRDLMFRLEREVTALNALTETYTKALRDHNNHLAEIARLQVHVKDNIMYYMQAIWTHEPPDQRFFRLHNTPVPDLIHTTRGFRVNFDHPLANTMAAPHMSLARFGGRDAKLYPVESVTKFNTQVTYKPLSEVADLDNLLGFKGNFAIFPLYQSNALTDFMMDPYIDRATGELVDPSDPLNWSLDEFSDYVCCLKTKLTDEEFQTLLPQLQSLYQAILNNPTRSDDVLVVPTNSLFIEALPAAHTLLERFKLDHRMIDVKKAQAEAREKELENVRRAARILAGERGDPNIDKRILIEGGDNFVVPAGDL